MHPYFNSRPPSRSVSRHLHFNSRTHKEVDPTAARIFCNSYLNFNSRPRKEVDLAPRKEAIKRRVFQLSTSRGGRQATAEHKVPQATFQLTTSRGGRQQFLRKKFSFQNHFLCSLHIIYSYYINIVFFSTLFLAKSSFFLVRIH